MFNENKCPDYIICPICKKNMVLMPSGVYHHAQQGKCGYYAYSKLAQTMLPKSEKTSAVEQN